ncbi:MAG: ATP-binding protein, partial [Alphaproteobacteria bacterium]|nr:ATP-binding protein [Alphaproteobacteria bacterium]
MLVEIRVSNFRSFKNEVVFSMEPSSRNGEKDNLAKIKFSKVPYVYKTSGIFGANAAGKTNLLTAFEYLRFIIDKGSSTKIEDKILSDCYLFSKDYYKKPTCLKIKFLKNSRLYEYEICLLNGNVVKEKAFFNDFSDQGSKRQKCIFSREQKKDGSYSFVLSKGIKKSWSDELLPQRVFLSDMINNRKADKKEVYDIYDFFQKDIYIINDKGSSFMSALRKIADDAESRKEIVEFTKNADFGLEDISAKYPSMEEFFEKINIKEEDEDAKEFFEQIRPVKAVTFHRTEEGEIKKLSFSKTESEGTKAYLAISELILKALKEGKVLLVDELDESLHPYLVRNLVNLFNNNESNAQLIFTS